MRIEANGIRINCEVVGETGPTLLLVHGLGGSLRLWTESAALLSPTCRVVTPDLRGHGDSEKPAAPYSIRLFADDLAAMCKAMGIERCIAVGSSVSAAVVIQLAADHPGLVQGVVSVGGFPALGQAGKDRMTQRAAAAESQGMEAVVDGVLSGALGASTHAAGPGRVAELRALLLRNDPTAYAAATRATVAADVIAAMERIKCPVLLVFGTEEKVAPLPAQIALKKGIPHALIRAIPAAGHLPFLEQPAAFTAALMEFVVGLAGTP